MATLEEWPPLLSARRDSRATLNLTACSSECHASAVSRIRDADVASTAADLVRTQMLQQGGLAALAQSNANHPNLILSLLR